MRVCLGANTSAWYDADGRHWFGPYSQAASLATFSAWEMRPATRNQSRRRCTALGRSCLQAVRSCDWLPGSSPRPCRPLVPVHIATPRIVGHASRERIAKPAERAVAWLVFFVRACLTSTFHGGFSCLVFSRPSSCPCSSLRAWAAPKGWTSARNRPLLLASRVDRVPGAISGQAPASVCLAVPSSAVRLGRLRNSASTAALRPRPDPARL